MITIKKLQQQINAMQKRINKQEKLAELDTIFNRIKKYQNDNINNSILIQINDLNKRNHIFTYASEEIKEETNE